MEAPIRKPAAMDETGPRRRRVPRAVLPLTALAAFVVLVALIHRSGNRDLLLVVLTLGILAPLVALFVERHRQARRVAAAREAAVRAELAALKAQVDPHFFFNTLNLLYGMAQQGDARTAETIQRLSDLMRFTIYEGRKDDVAIESEVEYLRNYLELSRMRYRELRDLRFDVDIDAWGSRLAPLLLIMLVENAIKHGVAHTGRSGFVHVELRVAKGRLTFMVENAVAAKPARPSGIGMSGLKRRLELEYPDRHSMTVRSDEDTWCVELVLEGTCAT